MVKYPSEEVLAQDPRRKEVFDQIGFARRAHAATIYRGKDRETSVRHGGGNGQGG